MSLRSKGSFLALGLALLSGSILALNGSSSVAHAGFPVSTPVPPLSQVADSLHGITLQLDERIAGLSALDSSLGSRMSMPIESAELMELACAVENHQPLSDIEENDAFELYNRIEQQQSLIERLSSVVETRYSLMSKLPMLVPCSGQYSSGFGVRVHPVSGRVKMHTGVDLAAPKGTPIFASGDGIVVFSGVKTGYGNVVEVDHGFGYHTLYGHSSKLLVAVGDTITRGDIIALVGSTGVSTGPHLHYEVIVDGTKVDPEHFLIEALPNTPLHDISTVTIARK